MPDHEQLGTLCLFGLLIVFYVVILGLRYLVEYWYVTLTTVTGLIALRTLWRRRYPLYVDDDDDVETVSTR